MFRFCGVDMENSVLESVLGLVHGILGPFVQKLVNFLERTVAEWYPLSMWGCLLIKSMLAT